MIVCRFVKSVLVHGGSGLDLVQHKVSKSSDNLTRLSGMKVLIDPVDRN
jgi:hypothetical protein